MVLLEHVLLAVAERRQHVYVGGRAHPLLPAASTAQSQLQEAEHLSTGEHHVQ